jgi:aminoglycoside phosphotransferase (APT) family kinase protein
MKFPTVEEFHLQFKSEIWHDVAENICRRHEISFDSLRRAENGESVVFLVDEKFVVKIYVPTKNGLLREKTSLEIARTNIKVPEIVGFGEIENYKYLITTQIKGELMTRDFWLKLNKNEQLQILSELAEGLKRLHRSDASKIDFDWNAFVAHQAENCFERQKSCAVNDKILNELPAFLEENLKFLSPDSPQVFLHGDVHFGNLRMLKCGEKWRISGLFDFADSLKGFREYDFLAVGLLMIQGQGDLQREFFRFFDYPDAEINETMRRRLMLLTCFYEWSDLRRYAIRLRPEAVKYSLGELEQAIWNFC